MCIAESNSPGAMVRTGFWKAPRRQGQSMEDKYLQIFLLTCPQRSPIGMFPLHFDEATAQTGSDKQQFLTVLDRLVTQGEIAVDGYWVLINNWWDHNSKPGPGLESQITRVLAEAPLLLKEKWIQIAQNADVYPFGWKEPKNKIQNSKAPTSNARGGGTRGTTDSGTPGKDNSKSNSKSNNDSKGTSKPTTGEKELTDKTEQSKSGCGGDSVIDYNCIDFSENSEFCRPIFLRVCRNLQLSMNEATQLGLELSARIDAADARPEYRIQHVEGWLEKVVKKTRASGDQILRAGISYADKIASQKAKVKNEQTQAAQKQIDQHTSVLRTNAVQTAIATMDTDELDQIIDAALNLLQPTARKIFQEDIREKVSQRKLPSGCGGSAVKRAIEATGLVPKMG